LKPLRPRCLAIDQRALLKRGATATALRLLCAQRIRIFRRANKIAIGLRPEKMRLDDRGTVRLTGAMSKSSPSKRSAAPGAHRGDDETARGRLLSAATHLFCRYGINATGIDAIINEAGTAKTTLYKLFGSKTNLVHAVLETEGKQWREWFIAAIESGGGSAQTKLARIFPSLKHWFCQERFYGCPFINAVGEHDKDQKQLRAIAMRHKKVVLAHIEKLASEMGAADPKMLAHQLALLMDGAIVAAMVTRDPAVADTAGLAAGSLFEPARARKPKRAGSAPAQLMAV
jgi:AcrR family transcriptional regulator